MANVTINVSADEIMRLAKADLPGYTYRFTAVSLDGMAKTVSFTIAEIRQ